MACLNCGRPPSDHEKLIYTTARGWEQCRGLVESNEVGQFIKIPGRSTYLKMYADTKSYRDRAVSEAAAKARKVSVGR